MFNGLIPKHRQCHDLFLLVGANPLPNWAATKLLLQPEGRVYLVYTNSVSQQARRLKTLLQEQDNIQVDLLPTDPADGKQIFGRVTERAKRVADNARVVGLNYTGGTKMMSVHAHRALCSAIPNRSLMLSYLDANSLELKFDQGETYDVSLAPEVCISIDQLAALHDDPKKFDYQKKAKGVDAAGGLAIIHSLPPGQKIWRKWYNRLQQSGFSEQMTLPREEDFSRDTKAALEDQKRGSQAIEQAVQTVITGYRQVLKAFHVQGGETLQEVVQRNLSDFPKREVLTNWLNGLWLEHYTLSQLATRRDELCINQDGLTINTRVTSTTFRKSMTS